MDFPWIISFPPHQDPMVLALLLPHFIDEKTEALSSQ